MHPSIDPPSQSPNQAEKTIQSIHTLSKKLSSGNIEVNSFGAAAFSRSDFIKAVTFMAFTIIALNLNLDNNAFIAYKLGLFLPIAAPFMVFKNFMKNKKSRLLSISIFQLFSSSAAFNLLIPKPEGEVLDIEFHANAEFNDLAFFAIWISIVFSFSKVSLRHINQARNFFMALATLKSIFVQIIVGTLQIKIVICMIFYMLIVWTEFYFIIQRLTKENENLKSSWDKASADLQEDLKIFGNEIQTSYKNIISSCATSEADEILLKLRLLKFQLMIEENPVNKDMRRFRKTDTSSSIILPKKPFHRLSVILEQPKYGEEVDQKVLIFTYIFVLTMC